MTLVCKGLAKKYGSEDLEALKGQIRERLEADFASTARQVTKRKLLDALDAIVSFELPESLVEAEAAQIAAGIEAGSQHAGTPAEALREGAAAYFAAMCYPGRIRLMLLEGPAVLGPEVMRRIDLEAGGRELRIGIAAALGDRASPTKVETIADLVSAMFDRAALARDAGADPKIYEDEIGSLLALIVR